MPPKLTVLRGRQQGTELSLDGKTVFDLGSAPGPAGFKLDGPGVAANHVRIFREDRKFTLFDLQGQGVAINGQKIQRPTILNDGDEISVGTVALRFQGVGASQQGAVSPLAAEPQGLSRPVSEAIDAPALLCCLEGTDKGKVWPLPKGRQSFTMGRGVSADIVIMDIKCSREHCRLEHRGGEYVVVDLGSTNGTKINGTKMPMKGTQVLKWGDQVRVGYSTLELRAAGAAAATAPTAKLGDREKIGPAQPVSQNAFTQKEAPAVVPPPRTYAPQPPPPPPTPRPAVPPPPPPLPKTAPMPAVAQKDFSTSDVTFDFGRPPAAPLPSRTAATDHVDDDEEGGREALRTFIFEDQPKDFGNVDQQVDTEHDLKRPKSLPKPAEPPLDDYAAPPPPQSKPAPPPPPPAPPKKKKKVDEPQDEDAALRTFVFDEAPAFEEKKEEEPAQDPALRTFVFDENPTFDEKPEPKKPEAKKPEAKKPEPSSKKPEPKKKGDEDAGDAALRTFVFDEAPAFEEKKEDEPAQDPALRTFVFDENPTFDEKPEAPKKKKVDDGAGDAALRTFVFDENPTFDEEPKAKKPAAPPPPPAKKPAPKRPADDDDDERPPEFRTVILDDGVPHDKMDDDEEPPDPTLRTFVFDNPPEF